MQQGKIKVLIIDDNEVDRNLYRIFLTKKQEERYSILEASTAEDGRKSILHENPDCTIVDFQLPDATGLDLMESVYHRAETAFVMVTGEGNEQIAVKAIQSGAQNYLKKGKFSQDDFILSIQFAIEKMQLSKKLIQQQKQLEEKAYSDHLTKLLNRSAFIQKLDDLFKAWQAKEVNDFAVAFIDLDRFKIINDSFGHIVGDKLLQRITISLKNCVRDHDILSRLGGDEFAVCFIDIPDIATVELICKKIEKTLHETLVIEGHTIHTSASIGVARVNSNYKESKNILRDADTAMYAAKHRGRNCYVIFEKKMHTQLKNRNTIENDLHKAIESQQIQVFYQPIFSVSNQEIISVEALLRWYHPQRECFISPIEFIPVAEETGLIHNLGDFVLNQACKDLKFWHRNGKGISLNVNVSLIQLKEVSFVNRVKDTLIRYGLKSELLQLELTESCLCDDTEKNLVKLKDLVHEGIKLALDDFGTGFSSLSRLRDFPIHTIKVDRSFLKSVPESQSNINLCKAIISMGRALSLKVTAEGVETYEHLDFLLSTTCDYFQGFLFSKPVPFFQITNLIEKYMNQLEHQNFHDEREEPAILHL